MKKFEYFVNDKKFTYSIEGDLVVGEEVVLLENDINLLQNTEWSSSGFTVVPFLNLDQQEKLKNQINQFLITSFKQNNVEIDSEFKLENYHKYVDDELHKKMMGDFKDCWNSNVILDFDFDLINNRVSEILGIKVTSTPVGDIGNQFCLRIVRPQKKQDNNPPHRDVWLDSLRNAVNLYYPICGSNLQSSLPILPKSHFLKESQILRTSSGAKIDGVKYTVPCALTVDTQSIKMITPNPQPNEVMIFSPYLIHGGAMNMNHDKTRVSLEMRFWTA